MPAKAEPNWVHVFDAYRYTFVAPALTSSSSFVDRGVPIASVRPSSDTPRLVRNAAWSVPDAADASAKSEISSPACTHSLSP